MLKLFILAVKGLAVIWLPESMECQLNAAIDIKSEITGMESLWKFHFSQFLDKQLKLLPVGAKDTVWRREW